MNVQPDFLDHPKFLLFKRQLGGQADLACELILRLWGHCQENKRGGDWGAVSASYVEMVCKWPGPEGVLYQALLKQMMPGRAGFAELKGKRFIVHDWDSHNASLIANWFRNPGGRGGKANGTPEASPGEAGGSPWGSRPGTNKRGEERKEEKGEGSERALEPMAGVNPSLEEVVARGGMLNLSREECTKFFQHYDGLDWTVNGNRMVRWWQWLPKWKARGQAYVYEKKNAAEKRGAGGTAPSREELELEGIEAELEWQREPGRIEVLKKRKAELKN